MEKEKKKSKLKIMIPVIIVIVVLAVIGILVFTSNDKEKSEQQMTKSEMLKIAESQTVTYFEDLKDNSALAETQKGKIFKVSGKIYNITKDHIEITASDTMLKMYLPKEELVDLKKDQEITVVGKLNNIKEKYFLGAEKIMFFDFNNCYVVKNAE